MSYYSSNKRYKTEKEAILSDRSKVWLRFSGIVLIGVIFGAIVYPFVPNGIPGSGWFNHFAPKLGLDLQGGAHLVYQADMDNIPNSERTDALEGVRDVIERRVNALGVSEPVVQTNKVGKNYRVIIELAGVFDTNEAIKQIGETPLLEFKEPNREGVRATSTSDVVAADSTVDEWMNTALTGKYLKRVQVSFDRKFGTPSVSLVFNKEGSKLFADITKRNIGRMVAIFLDGEPISTPVVQSAITSWEAVITGNFTVSEAQILARRLNAGALPVPIHLVSQLQVGPALGSMSVNKSMIAGLWGLIAVMVFMILVYRLPGLLANIALVFYGVIVIGFFEIIPVTLTLAGIAGFILSIGMAVDANVLIFERVKEELRVGLAPDRAVTVGFKHAWSAIRDGNVTTLIIAFILLWAGTPLIKGFAMTLSLGVLVSMFSAVTITRVFIRQVIHSRIGDKKWLFGTKVLKDADKVPKMLSIVPKRSFWYTLSVLAIAASFGLIATGGLKPGIDFTGGTLMEVEFINKKPTAQQVRESLSHLDIGFVTVQPAGEREMLLRMRDISENEHQQVLDSIAKLDPEFSSRENGNTARSSVLRENRFETIGPSIGREIARKAIISLIGASLVIIAYVAYTFRKVSEPVKSWKYGVVAVSTLLHDVVIVTGVFALLGHVIGLEFGSMFVSALLTVLGYSVNDTIVVFDRIRENLFEKRGGETFAEVVNTSVNQTIWRSVNTSLSTLLVLFALYFFGGMTIHYFVLALIVGVVVGTYSSIFIASPLLFNWHKDGKKISEAENPL